MAKLFLIGQFAVSNLLYGPQFEKQMLICSYEYYYLENKWVKGSYHVCKR